MKSKSLLDATNAMRALINECDAPTSLLPIHQAFPKFRYEHGHPDKTILQFHLNCQKDALMPGALVLEIRAAQKEIFKDVIITTLHPRAHKYPKANMRLTKAISISNDVFFELWNNPDVEVIFSHMNRSSTFQLYI